MNNINLRILIGKIWMIFHPNDNHMAAGIKNLEKLKNEKETTSK